MSSGRLVFYAERVADGPLDLLSILLTSNSSAPAASSVILRRGLNLASGSVMPVLDFGKQEAVAPATGAVSAVGAPSAGVSLEVDFQTAGGSFGVMSVMQAPGSVVGFSAVPSSLLAAGDLHQFVLEDESTGPAGRLVYTFSRSRRAAP